MFLKKIKLNNFLSYGPQDVEIKLHDLNILVGPNGSGKSNLFEAISLLRSTPKAIVAPVRKGGGVFDWLWKGAQKPTASISFDFENKFSPQFSDIDINYSLDFTVINNRFEIIKEKIENVKPVRGNSKPYLYYSHDHFSTVINIAQQQRSLKREDIDPEASIFSQRKDPDNYPEITHLGKKLEEIKIYREWHFGVDCVTRQSQPTDGDSSFLQEDCSNLALVFNSLLSKNPTRKKIMEEVKNIYEGADEVSVRIDAGRAIVQILEADLPDAIPANRLSDGTLRYLCLMAILLNPNDIPLICLDEPELGMHPDLICGLAKMLIAASKHTQIIVNTHSPLLLDAFSDYPEDILICQKTKGCSVIEPIPTSLYPVIQQGSLGQLWMQGELGGTRW